MSLENMSEWLGSPAWMRDAECQYEPWMPWTVDGDQLHKYEIRAMVAVCADCPVLDQCRRYVAAQPEGEVWGFWAGESRPGMTAAQHARYVRLRTGGDWRLRARDEVFAAAAARSQEAAAGVDDAVTGPGVPGPRSGNRGVA